jgi:hypothetical protein
MKDLKKYDCNFEDNQPTQLNGNSISEMMKVYYKNCESIETNSYPFPNYEICTLMQKSFRILHFIANKPYLL